MVLFKGHLIEFNPSKEIKIDGEFIKLPEIGQKFIIVKNLVQNLKTSEIEKIISESEEEIVFKTSNMLYKLNYEIVNG